MNFLGQVNTFHGRLEGGKIHFASMALDSPHNTATLADSVRIFVRPHDLEIEKQRNGHPAIPARVKRIHSAGANVRLELHSDSGELLLADVPQNRFRALLIAVGSQVFVSPREVKVFSGGVSQGSFVHGEGI